MVSHLVLIADASGDVAIVERAPGEPAVRAARAAGKVPLTNHFEGPLARDPANGGSRRSPPPARAGSASTSSSRIFRPGASVERGRGRAA